MDLDAGQVRVVSDGKTLTTAIAPFKKYTASPAPKTITFDTFREGPLGSVALRRADRPGRCIVAGQPAGGRRPGQDDRRSEATRARRDPQVRGRTAGLLIDRAEGPDYPPARRPGHQAPDGDRPGDRPQGPGEECGPRAESRDRTARLVGGLGLDRGPQGRRLRLSAPEGILQGRVVPAARRPMRSKGRRSASCVGKPAPDFTLTVLDGAGKTRTLSKARPRRQGRPDRLLGDLVRPLPQELPEIQKLVEAYAKDKKDVVIVALSQDSEPQEPGRGPQAGREDAGRRRRSR